MKFTVKRNGRKVGTIEADDARDVGVAAINRWGAGTYDISMVRDESGCLSCGAPLHGGEDFGDVCMDCDSLEEPTQ